MDSLSVMHIYLELSSCSWKFQTLWLQHNNNCYYYYRSLTCFDWLHVCGWKCSFAGLKILYCGSLISLLTFHQHFALDGFPSVSYDHSAITMYRGLDLLNGLHNGASCAKPRLQRDTFFRKKKELYIFKYHFQIKLTNLIKSYHLTISRLSFQRFIQAFILGTV